MTDVERITLQLIRSRIGVAEYAHTLATRHNCGTVSDSDWDTLMAMNGAVAALMNGMVWNDPDNYESGEIGCEECDSSAQRTFEWLVDTLQSKSKCCEDEVEIHKILNGHCPCCNTCECEEVVADIEVTRKWLSSFPGYRIVIDIENSRICSGVLSSAAYKDEASVAYAIYDQDDTLLWYVSIGVDADVSVPGNWTYFSGTLPLIDFQNKILIAATGTGKKWYLDEATQTQFVSGDTMKIVAFLVDTSCEVSSGTYDVDHITIA
ncbi:hypothetical protein [uncultured Sphaerochaeta sp.]|uniref:hypothetical protein n=1 Tax=uncultured Sphaerochaeta sp. TaxID=886478 RepID=UPI002621974F|nr:hypothetical protein [uncultured Sphaerochaeta sp.]